MVARGRKSVRVEEGEVGVEELHVGGGLEQDQTSE